MKDRHQQLMVQVSELPDKELLHILDEESSDYRFETIVYAKAEADKRGLSYSQLDIASLNSHSTRTLTSELIEIFRSHIFGIGFLVTLSFFVLSNYVNYTQILAIQCSDCPLKYGFPFTYYISGGWGSMGIYWFALALDIALPFGASVAIGWLCKRILGLRKKSS